MKDMLGLAVVAGEAVLRRSSCNALLQSARDVHQSDK